MILAIHNRAPLTREQEKAMFAKAGRGGNAPPGRAGASGSSSSSSRSTGYFADPPIRGSTSSTPRVAGSGATYTDAQRKAMLNPDDSKLWAQTKAYFSGLGSGAKGGATIAADKLTFGLIAPLKRAADSYVGSEYDVSRGASTVARESLLSAAGIGLASKLGAAWKGTALARSAAGQHTAPLLAVAGFGSQSAINDYRAENPTINPYADKALAMAAQLSGYLGSIGVLGSAHKYGGALLSKLAINGRSLSDYAKTGIKVVDNALGSAGSFIGSKLPASVASKLKSAHAAYSKFSDFTGASIKDLLSSPSAVGRLKRANALAGRASEHRSAAFDMATAATAKEAGLKKIATDALDISHKASLAGSPNAEALYVKARNAFYAVEDAAAASAKAQKQIAAQARRLTAKADKLRADALSSIKKASYVAGGMTAVGAYDEYKIAGYEQQAAQAIREGKSFTYPTDDPRSVIGTIIAASIGTTGNPIEKQSRPGRAAWQAETGAYRAGYQAIVDAGNRGELSAKQVQDQLAVLAARKPYNMAGRELWSFAPAAAAFLNWKIGDLIAEGKRSNTERAFDIHDADTIKTDVNPQSIRFLDINAPEIDNPAKGSSAEFLGDAAAARIKELIKPGQYVRVVSDSNAKAAGTDKYGRKLGYVETLPKPFDNLLRIPYLGKIIPAVDVNKKLIEDGMVDIHYRDLSGRTDRAFEYDKAREKAQSAGAGVWSEDGRTALPWVGKEKTVAERREEYFRRATKGGTLPPTPVNDLATTLGLGLMTTGNAGIFGQMPRAGQATAQTYNAVLAVLGALEYNERARTRTPRKATPPKAVKTDYQRQIDEAMKAYRTPQLAFD